MRNKISAEFGEAVIQQETKDGRERRRSLGIYYTPPQAAMILARWAIRQPNESVLEPSFGGCAMLSAAVSVFKSLGNNSPSNQLYGYDVDSAAFDHLDKMGITNAAKHFKKQDFLCSKAGNLKVDAVLANPPFVSYHRQDEQQRELTDMLRQQYLPQLPKLASLWAFFLLHSMSFLRPGGRMAFLLPNAIGSADYARPLLIFLQQKFSKVDLVHVSERLFIQAGADERISLLLLSDYKPDGVDAPASLLTRDILRIDELLEDSNNFAKSSDLGDVRQLASASITELINSGVLIELGSVASVNIGEVIGDINFFVKPLSSWRQEKIDKTYLFPLLTRAAQVKGLYVAEPKSQNAALTIPHVLRPPTQRLPLALKNYLSVYAEDRIIENKTFEKRDIWYRCSYETSADAFIGSMSHDYPRIIGNDAGISCANAFYKIFVKEDKELARWLPILGVTTPLRLSAEILGRVRGSGGIKLEPSDVKKLCIPNKLPKLSLKEFNAVRERISHLISTGELDAAGQLADSLIFLKTGLISAKEMTRLRMMRLTFTNRRLVKLGKASA